MVPDPLSQTSPPYLGDDNDHYNDGEGDSDEDDEDDAKLVIKEVK